MRTCRYVRRCDGLHSRLVYYRWTDSPAFLHIYHSTVYLMRRKGAEGALCTLVPLG